MTRIILDQFIPRHGCPRLMISDQGTEYCNALLDMVHKELGLSRIHTSSYHPQSNGKTERFHRCMNEMIQKQISEDQTKWYQQQKCCQGRHGKSGACPEPNRGPSTPCHVHAAVAWRGRGVERSR